MRIDGNRGVGETCGISERRPTLLLPVYKSLRRITWGRGRWQNEIVVEILGLGCCRGSRKFEFTELPQISQKVYSKTDSVKSREKGR